MPAIFSTAQQRWPPQHRDQAESRGGVSCGETLALLRSVKASAAATIALALFEAGLRFLRLHPCRNGDARQACSTPSPA